MFGWLKRDKQEEAIVVDPPIMRVDGMNGRSILLYDNRLVITTKSVAMTLAHGIQTDKEIYLSSLAGMQITPPNWWRQGFIAFMFHGDQDVEAKVAKRMFGDDEYTVWFKNDVYPDVLKLKAEIDRRKA